MCRRILHPPSAILFHFIPSRSSTREQRKLAAIIAADVVGYLPPHGARREWDAGAATEHRKEVLEPALATAAAAETHGRCACL